MLRATQAKGPTTNNGSGGGGGGAPATASYVVMALDATLTNERILTAGAGIVITDGGAGGAVTVSAGLSASPDRGVVTAPVTGVFTVGPYWDAALIRWGLASAPLFDFTIEKSTGGPGSLSVVIRNAWNGAFSSAYLDVSAGDYGYTTAGAEAQVGIQGATLKKATNGYLEIANDIAKIAMSPTATRLAIGVGTVTPTYHWDVVPDGSWPSAVTSAVRNRSASATNVRFLAEVFGTGTGDPYSQWSIAGVSNAVIGLDNSASDFFGAWYSATPGTTPIWVYDPANVRMGVLNNAPSHSLDVSLSAAGATVTSAVRNGSAAASSDAQNLIEVSGSTAGNPYSRWSIAGNANASIGLANATNDQFGAYYSGTIGTTPIWVYDPPTTFFGILTNNPAYQFDMPRTLSGGDVIGAFRNRSNTANSHAYVYVAAEDSAGGNAGFRAGIGGVSRYSVWGIDNVDADKSGWWDNNTGVIGTTPVTVYDPANQRLGFLTAAPGYRWHARWDSAGTEVFSTANIVGELRLDVLGGYSAAVRVNPQVAGGVGSLSVSSYAFATEVTIYAPAGTSEGEITCNNSLYIRSSAGTGRVIVNPVFAIRNALAVNPATPPSGDTNIWVFDDGATRELRVRYYDGSTAYNGALVLT